MRSFRDCRTDCRRQNQARPVSFCSKVKEARWPCRPAVQGAIHFTATAPMRDAAESMVRCLPRVLPERLRFERGRSPNIPLLRGRLQMRCSRTGHRAGLSCGRDFITARGSDTAAAAPRRFSEPMALTCPILTLLRHERVWHERIWRRPCRTREKARQDVFDDSGMLCNPRRRHARTPGAGMRGTGCRRTPASNASTG